MTTCVRLYMCMCVCVCMFEFLIILLYTDTSQGCIEFTSRKSMFRLMTLCLRVSVRACLYVRVFVHVCVCVYFVCIHI